MFRFLCLALLASMAMALDVEDCGSLGSVASVTVTGCDSIPCEFVKGNKYEIAVEFLPSAAGEDLSYAITASVSIITIPIKKGDACPDVGCPIDGSATVSHAVEVEITDEYIEVEDAKVKVVYTSGGRQEVCVSALANISGGK